jgi:hypothetical protein
VRKHTGDCLALEIAESLIGLGLASKVFVGLIPQGCLVLGTAFGGVVEEITRGGGDIVGLVCLLELAEKLGHHPAPDEVLKCRFAGLCMCCDLATVKGPKRGAESAVVELEDAVQRWPVMSAVLDGDGQYGRHGQ